MVIEKKNEVDYPVHCGEGINDNALKNNGINPYKKWIVKDEKGYCIDRRLLEQSLIQEAVDFGCNLQLSTKIKNIKRKNGFIRVKSPDAAFFCRIFIGIEDTILHGEDWLEFYSSCNFAIVISANSKKELDIFLIISASIVFLSLRRTVELSE